MSAVDHIITSGAHFQMFLFGAPAKVRWRLLSGNNRDMCHGVQEFAETQTCKTAIEQFQLRLPILQSVIRRDDRGDWTWLLVDNGTAVAVAGHSYDRQIRCSRAMDKVLQDGPAAVIRTQMVVSDHRRWAGSTRLLTSAKPMRLPRGLAREQWPC